MADTHPPWAMLAAKQIQDLLGTYGFCNREDARTVIAQEIDDATGLPGLIASLEECLEELAGEFCVGVDEYCTDTGIGQRARDALAVTKGGA